MVREWMEQLIAPVYELSVFKDLVQLPEWTPEQIMQCVIAFSWILYTSKAYLSYRQYQVVKNTHSMPPELSGEIDRSTFFKSRLYELDERKFHLIASFYDQLFETFILISGGIPFLWALSGRSIVYFGYGKEHEITQTAAFVLICSLITTMNYLPWSLYSTFVIEEKHGFNKETLGFFVKDRLMKFIVVLAYSLLIFPCIVYIVKFGGDYFFVILWLFCVVITLVLINVYADLIAPLFDKFTPLPEGNLRSQIETLAKSMNFPLKKLYIVESSKRSAHSNAYLYGFYKSKRIVLFDTLIEEYTSSNEGDNAEDEGKKRNATEEEMTQKKTVLNNDEILAVVAHELGHWKLNHVMKTFIIVQVNEFLAMVAFGFLFKNETLYAAFGFKDQQPVIVGLVIIFQYVFSPYNEVLSFLMAALSNRFQLQADAFALLLNREADHQSSDITFNRDNLGFPVGDWLTSTWVHFHPPLLQRLHALGKLD